MWNEIKTFPHTDRPLFLANRLISVAFIPYVAQIWLPVIFQLVNGDLCRVRNERVGAETWSSFRARWVLLTWFAIPPTSSLRPHPFLTPHCGRQEEGEGRADCCTEPNYQRIFLCCRSKQDVKKRKKINRLHLHIQHNGVNCRPLCRLITWPPQDHKIMIPTQTLNCWAGNAAVAICHLPFPRHKLPSCRNLNSLNKPEPEKLTHMRRSRVQLHCSLHLRACWHTSAIFTGPLILMLTSICRLSVCARHSEVVTDTFSNYSLKNKLVTGVDASVSVQVQHVFHVPLAPLLQSKMNWFVFVKFVFAGEISFFNFKTSSLMLGESQNTVASALSALF